MTHPHGLGAILTPPDPRDWPIDLLYAESGLSLDAVVPTSHLVAAPYPPFLDQGTSPMCVAYSQSWAKSYQDLRDTGAANLNESAFFYSIGGSPAGAVPRFGLNRLIDYGYPEVTAGFAAKHRISAYYAVPLDKLAIQNAILAFGPVLVSFDWPENWFSPNSQGVLPFPNQSAGGHSIVAIGWDARGLRLRNSWGTDYGAGGDVFMPWPYIGQMKEVWKTVDQVITPPPTAAYRIRIAAGASIQAVRSFGTKDGQVCIKSWLAPVKWGPKASSAPCQALVTRIGCSSGRAPLVYVPGPAAAAISGRWIRITSTVTVVRV